MKPSVIKGRILYPKCAKTRICNLKNYFGVTPLTPRYKSEREIKGGRGVEERGGEGRGRREGR
jgi:hypothetical protein